MGSRGPIPDPRSGRTKAGRNTRTRKTQPAASTCGVDMPDNVRAVPTAAAFWERVAPTLVGDGRLLPEHADSFAILCRLHAEIRQLEDQLQAEGFVTASEKGQAASPVAKLLRDSRRDFVTLARDFGLTAAAAARIPQDQSDGEEENDPEAALLAKLSLRGR